MKYLRKYWAELLIFFFFLLVTLVVTYPTIFELGGSFYGKPADPLGSIWQLWWLKYAIWQKHISPNFCPLLAAPFGIDLTSLMGRDIFSNHFMRLPLLFLNEVVVYNLFLLLTFLLSAVTMYFLVHYFTKNRLASMVAGIMYAFCPYHLTHAQQHFGLAQIQWMSLYVLFLFKLDDDRTYKYALLCALAFSLNLFADIHYGYFMLIFTATFVVWRMWQGIGEQRAESREKNSVLRALSSKFRAFKVILVTVFATLIFTLPFTYPILKTQFTTPQTKFIAFKGDIRPLRDLFGNSARPLSYLLPSQENPVFGGYTKQFVKTPFYGGHPVEHTLYLGWVGIVLSIVAIRGWRRRNRKQRAESREQRTESREQRAESGENNSMLRALSSRLQDQGSRSQKGVSFFLFATIVALLFSHSPYTEIGNFRILFPSYFMYKVLPMFRVCARFGILAMLCVSVLTGIGLTSILEKIKNVNKKRVFLSMILLLVFVEFAPTLPAPMVNAVNPPPVYEWLAKQEGDFTIAEYPLKGDQEYQFWQRIHQKRLVNGTLSGTYADKVRREIVNILKPKTPGILKYLGAKYVILHSGKYLKSEDVPIIGEIPNLRGQPGLKLIKVFDKIEVYEINAQPVKPVLKD